MIILDGKEISYTEFQNLDTKNIESIEVIKDDSGIAIYGEKAKKGVIVISSKKIESKNNIQQTPPTSSLQGLDADNLASNVKTDKPLILIDGVEVARKDLSMIDPMTIISISVLKQDKGIEMYGKNGVVLVTTDRYKNTNN